jgi:hypothetical protein
MKSHNNYIIILQVETIGDAYCVAGGLHRASSIYSGTCAIRHLSFLTCSDIRQKGIVPKYFW